MNHERAIIVFLGKRFIIVQDFLQPKHIVVFFYLDVLNLVGNDLILQEYYKR